MKTWITALCTSLSLLAGAAVASPNPVVYQQPWTGTGSLAYASQFDTGANGDFAKMYDDFSLATTTSITDIHWTGQYFSGSRTNGVDSFLIQFWSNAGGPGTLLYSATIAGTNVNETLISGDDYTYDADLATAFTAQAGTTYWVSIQATMLFPPQWGWMEGTGGNGVAFQDFFGTRARIGADLAFSLTGKPADIPEPASLLLVGLALTSLGVARRAKSQR
jgi:hypothetical protein